MESTFITYTNQTYVKSLEGLSPAFLNSRTMDYVVMLAIMSGIAMHLLVFRRGEWDVASPSIVVAYASTIMATALISTSQLQMPLQEVIKIAGYHFCGLFASMLLYRAFFHRLSRYPGPFLARLSTFYITARSVRKLHLFEEVRSLHAQYGDIVRIGM